MKHILTILLIVSLGTVHAQFINTTVTGSPSTLFKSRGGIGADSAFVILNSYPDTATANYSVVSRYNSIIRVGTTYYYRTLNPNKWNLFTSGAVGTYMLVTDTTSMLSNYYNKTASDSKYALRSITVAGSPISSNVTLATLTAGGYTNGVTYNGSSSATIIPDTTKLATKTDINNKANWDIAYNGRVANLTTSGSSGSASFVSNVLNIPTYTISGLGGIGVGDTATMLSPYQKSFSAVKYGDTATMLSGYYNKTATDSRYQPLEDQRLSTSNAPTFSNITGTGIITLSNTGTSLTQWRAANPINASGRMSVIDAGTSSGIWSTYNTSNQRVGFIGDNASNMNYVVETVGGAHNFNAKLNISGDVNAVNGNFTNNVLVDSLGAVHEVYAGNHFKSGGNYQLATDSTGLQTYTGGYKFYAVQAGLNAWYTPQPIVANKFVKSGGTSAQYLMADGSVSTGGSSSSTYTPTLTNTTNLTGTPSLYQASYNKNGNIVTVSIGCTIAASGAGTSVLTFTLPFTSAYGVQVGCGTATVQENGGTAYATGIISTTSGTQGTLTYKATTTGSSTVNITFQYSL